MSMQPCRHRTVDGRVPWLIGSALLLAVVLLSGSGPARAAPVIDEFEFFKGTTRGDPGTDVFIPPDTMGAKGPGHFAELINGAFAVYQPNGDLIKRVSLKAFWNDAFQNTANNPVPGGPPPPLHTADNPFDPRILYDPIEQRWYAVAVDRKKTSDSRLLVAVTTGTDPTLGHWRGFSLKADNAGEQWADFPTLGYSGTGVYIATHMLDIPNDQVETIRTVNLTGIPKSSLNAAIPSIIGYRQESNIGVAFNGTLQPAVDHLGAGAFYNAPYKAFSISPQLPKSIEILEIPNNFLNGGQLQPAVPFDLPMALEAPPNAAYNPTLVNLQPIDTGSLKLSSNVVLGYTGYWAAVAVKDPNTGNAAIRWFRIDPETTPQPILETGLIVDEVGNLPHNFFYPSIAVNALNQVVIGFNAMFTPEVDVANVTALAPMPFVAPGKMDLSSNTTTFGPLFGFVLGDLKGPYEVIDPPDPDDPTDMARNRWGDYSATTIDPNNFRFWTIQEIPVDIDRWATEIIRLSLEPDCVLGLVGCIYGSQDAQAYSRGFSLEDIRFKGLFDVANLPDELTNIGDMQIERYSLFLDAVLRFGAHTFVLHDVLATMEQKFTLSFRDDISRVFETELLALEIDLTGRRHLPFDAFIHLDPGRASRGRLGLTDLGVAGMALENFLDLFTAISIDVDGDRFFDTTLAAAIGSHFVLDAAPIPEPSTLVLVGFGAVALLGYGQSRARSRRISSRAWRCER
jgi:hypothetical protein